MKGLWSRKLPALVLAAIMTVGLVTPAALAVDHNYSSKWTTDATYHWHACTDTGCTARGDYEEHSFGGIQVDFAGAERAGVAVASAFQKLYV